MTTNLLNFSYFILFANFSSQFLKMLLVKVRMYIHVIISNYLNFKNTSSFPDAELNSSYNMRCVLSFLNLTDTIPFHEFKIINVNLNYKFHHSRVQSPPKHYSEESYMPLMIIIMHVPYKY